MKKHCLGLRKYALNVLFGLILANSESGGGITPSFAADLRNDPRNMAAEVRKVVHEGNLESTSGQIALKFPGSASATPWESYDQTAPIYSKENSGKISDVVAVSRIRIKDRTANIIVGSRTLRQDSQGWIEFEVPLHKEQESFTVQIVSATGEVREIYGQIVFPEYQTLMTAKPKKFTATVGLGPTYVSFNEDGVTSFTQVALTTKFGINYQFLGKAFDLGASGYLNAYPNFIASNGYIQMFGGNIRGGFLLPLKSLKKLKIKVLGGYYYLTTISASGSFGFKNIGGVQIYPTASYSFDDRKSIGVYFKYAPFFGKTTFFSASNFEAAAGIAYNFPVMLFKKNLAFSAGLDFAFLNFADPSFPLRMSTYSASIAYVFQF